jgi:hypothetical protein
MADLNALINISVQNQALLQQVNAQFNKLNETARKTNESVTKLNTGFRRLFAGILSGATLRQAVTQFGELERAETNLADSLSRNTRLSDGFADSLKRQATELGRAGGFVRAQVTQLQGYTAVLGLAEDQTLALNEAIVGLAQRSTAGVDEIAKSVQRAITSGEISETLGPLIGAAPAGFNRLSQSERADFISSSQPGIVSSNEFSKLFATLNDAIAEFARTINFVFGPAIRAFTEVVGRLNEAQLTGPIAATGVAAGGLLGLGALTAAAKQLAPVIARIVAGASRVAKLASPVGAVLAIVVGFGQFLIGFVEGITETEDVLGKLFDATVEGIDDIGRLFESVIEGIKLSLENLAGLGEAIGVAFRELDFTRILTDAAVFAERRTEARRSREGKDGSGDTPFNEAATTEEEERLRRLRQRDRADTGPAADRRRQREIAESELRISDSLDDQAKAYRLQGDLLQERRDLLKSILAEERASSALILERNPQTGQVSKQNLENYERQARVVGQLEEELKDVEIQLSRNRIEAGRFGDEIERIRDEAAIRNQEAAGRADILANVGRFANNEGANRQLQLDTLKRRIQLTEKLVALNERRGDEERASQLRVELVGLQEQAKQLELQIPLLGQVISDNLVTAFDQLIDGTKSVKQAFSDMVRSILADITRLLARAAVLGLIGAAFNSQAGGESAGLFSALLNGLSGGRQGQGAYQGGLATTQGIKRFAGGGMVPGPAISRDIIPALLTPGEIVLNAAQQRRVASGLVSQAPMITNINAFDQNDILNAVAEREGQSVNLNVIRRNRQQVRRMLR